MPEHDPALVKEIRDGLEPLLKEAEATGKWLWCSYQDIWFTPAEMRAQNDDGRFLWAASNWRLRDPQEKLDEIDQSLDRLQAERARVVERIRAAVRA